MIDISPKPDFSPRSAVVLGSTGSIGCQALDILREMHLPVRFLAAGENVALLAEQIKEFSPPLVSVSSESAAKALREMLGSGCPEVLCSESEIFDAVETTDADIIYHSVSGLDGIGYAMAAARSGKRIGMANKEAIIALGDVIFDEVCRSGGQLIPVDSEHCAVYRCIEGRDTADISRIILTASGGPFFGRTPRELENVTVKETLAHPTWKMGKKITVDSATLMNKGFEIIEAVRLFGLPEDRVDVVIHRQSIIHSLVEYNDNTLLAQLGKPDMRDCIRYAATAPHSRKTAGERLDLAAISKLTFDTPDTSAFPLLNSARAAIRRGGCAPAALIAADEEAVDAFLAGKIGFADIPRLVNETLGAAEIPAEMNEENVAAAVRGAKVICVSLISGRN